MSRGGHDEVVAGDGALEVGGVAARYWLRQPAPTQWVAVSVVRQWRAGASRLLVGVGSSPELAVDDLAERLAAG